LSGRGDIDREVSLTLVTYCALAAAVISSSLFYIRRLYKDIFAQGFRANGEPESAHEFATYVYFLSRPFFSILFALVAVVSGVAFIHAATVEGARLSFGFLLITMILSAYGGSITGGVIKQIESQAAEKLRNFGGEI